MRGKRESNVVRRLLRPRQCQAESPDHLEEKGCLITQQCGYISLTAVIQMWFIVCLYLTCVHILAFNTSYLAAYVSYS